MPETKHVFTGGKMNKDLDERLISKDQYRNAINIQVSSSEDSEVGTIQNILGNEKINLSIIDDSLIQGKKQKYNCVGCISDEKNDTSYWFLAGERLEPINFYNISNNASLPNVQNSAIRDYIISINTTNNVNSSSIVFTDYKSIPSRTEDPNVYPAVINIISNKIYIPSANIGNISVGDTLLNIIDQNGLVSPQNTKVTRVYDSGITGPGTSYIIVESFTDTTWLNFSTGSYLALEFASGNLMFDHDNLITGINIIDDLLFWTDNENEPKVINIERCLSGTSQLGFRPTTLFNPNLIVRNPRRIIHSDIHVIKRKPTKKITVDYSVDRRSGILQGFTEHSFNNNSGVYFDPGHEGQMTISTNSTGNSLAYNIGDIILILNDVDISNGARILPFEYDVKIVIKDINTNLATGISQVTYEIISISSNTPLTGPNLTLGFQTVLEESISSKFENEMMRFSYRYRYLDKEVSAFAPFSEVAFEPSEFAYNQKNAYNYGMVNNIRNLKLKNFIDVENTLGIESVDILVKFENSPLVYVVDTINRKDFPHRVNDNETPFFGEYDFNPKSIKGVLPENQMLRPWDAVPNYAKAQEVVGNRIVYGNYNFGYNFSLSDFDLNISSSIRPINVQQPYDGAPSVKSKRNYQVGIVFLDEEGRESPVFSNADAAINVPKSYCGTNTMLSVTNNCEVPLWAKSYKYYVKDSSLPAYNIVVDAFYRAENGDFWVAVPSSERNKVQEGDFLELKKGINSNKPVEIDIVTKAIAIDDVAPDFIKTKYRRLGKAPHSTSQSDLFQVSNAEPRVGSDSFKISKNFWLTQHSAGFGGGGELDREGLNDLSVVFSAADTSAQGGVYRSKRYDCGRIGLYGSTQNANYTIKLDEPIRTEDDWIAPTSANPVITNPNIRLEVFEKIILPNSEFEGKFFIKIEAKEDLIPNLAPSDTTVGYETVLKEFNVFNFSEPGSYASSWPTQDNLINSANNGGVNTIGYTINNQVQLDSQNFGTAVSTSLTAPASTSGFAMDTQAEWAAFLPYHTQSSGIQQPTYWFIDRMYYKAVQDQSTPNELNIMGPSSGDIKFGLGVFQSQPQQLQNYNSNTLYMGQNSPIVTHTGRYFMELSVVGCMNDIISIGPSGATINDAWDQSYAQVGGSSSTTWGWVDNNGNPVFNANSENVEILSFLKTPSQKFKWKNSSEVFTIINSYLEWRFNYADGSLAINEAYNDQAHGQNPSLPPVGNDLRQKFKNPLNRRLTVILELDKNPLAYGIDPTDPLVANAHTPVEMVFIEQNFNVEPGEGLRTSNPAVFEAEKIDEEKLDIYYEASEEIPVNLNTQTLRRLIPEGSRITSPSNPDLLGDSTIVKYHQTLVGQTTDSTIVITGHPTILTTGPVVPTYSSMWQDLISNNEKLQFTTPTGEIISLRILQFASINNPEGFIWPAADTIGLNCNVGLGWSNCISFRNGVESVYLKDSFNKTFLNKGVKVSSSLQGEYKQETKTNGLIYSGLYNENSETNNLNQFIQAEKITKDINPSYGSIQKLHTRDTDLITLCEDKVLKILANKDAVFNADGNTQLTATQNVLGQTIPFVGEYGISKNPESFASESYRAYFSDKVRGAIIRLSKDGLTPISDHGMKDWVRDNLKITSVVVGSYDDYKKEYNISLKNLGGKFHTVSFKENVRGWVSFKSFKPQQGLSCANNYYTFGGRIDNFSVWKHHSENVDRNTFYGEFENSEFEVILNENPSVIKKFHTINYEGSQSKIEEFKQYDTYLPGTNTVVNTYNDLDYYNLNSKKGWFVSNIFTDLTYNDNINVPSEGFVPEFIEKEGKWFNYIKGKIKTNANGGLLSGIIDSSDISFQGLGRVSGTPVSTNVYGCTSPTAVNYNSTATFDDGSCIPCVYGCMETWADNYNTSATCDDGSCSKAGCTNPLAFNYDAQATVDNGSCIAVVLGCTDPTQFNYNPLANTDDGSCIPVVLGCMDTTADNYNTAVNTDDGSCLYSVFGCPDSIADNYYYNQNPPLSPNTTLVDDGSCTYTGCDDPNAVNTSAVTNLDTVDNNLCLYCNTPNNVNVSYSYTSSSTSDIYISWDPSPITDQPAVVDNYVIDVGLISSNTGQLLYPPHRVPTWDPITSNWNYPVHGTYGGGWNMQNNGDAYTPGYSMSSSGITISGLTSYNVAIYMTTLCQENGVNIGVSDSVVMNITIPTPTYGCTDPSATNYDPSVNFDDGSCIIEISGCTDINASNYNPNATIDDGSCTGLVLGCMDYRVGYSPDINGNNNPHTLNQFQPWGTTANPVNNFGYDPNFTSGPCGIPCTSDGTSEGNAWGYLALNYDPNATYGQWSSQCIYGQAGDTDYDSRVGVNDLLLVNGYNWLSSPGYAKGGDVIPGNDLNLNLSPDSYVNLQDLTLLLGNWMQSIDSSDPNFGLIDSLRTSFASQYVDNTNIYGLILEEIDNTGGAFANGEKTYRLYMKFKDNNNSNNSSVQAIFGDENNINNIQTTTTFFNADVFGANFDIQNEVPLDAFPVFPQLEYDTWVALGDSYSNNDAPTTIGDAGLGSNFSGSSWTFGGTVDSDAAIFRNPTDTLTAPDANGRVLLGQFTTDGEINTVQLNISGIFTDFDGQARIHKNNFNNFTTIYLTDTPGCTNNTASNYDATANVDDGTCVIYGCMDSTATNYSANATINNVSSTDNSSPCTY